MSLGTISWHFAVIGAMLYCWDIHCVIAVSFCLLVFSSAVLSTNNYLKLVVG
jgi:hypothetical protein